MLSPDTLKSQFRAEEVDPVMGQRFLNHAGEGKDDFSSAQDSGPFDMEAYITRHGFPIKARLPMSSNNPGVMTFQLETCPFDPNHGTDSRLTLSSDGRPGFHCFHNGCAGKTIKDVFAQYPPRSSVVVVKPDQSEIVSYGAQLASEFKYTDVGNAKRFIEMFGDIIRYVPDFNQWLLWSETEGRWVPDRLLGSAGLGIAFTERLILQAIKLHREDSKKSAQMYAHALRSQQQPRLEAMLKLARALPGVGVTPEDLNKDGYLFNCANGTIDLRTAELRPWRKADLITMRSPVKFEPEAVCEEWNTFLHTAMCGKQVLIDFLQRAAGYSLAGVVREEVFLFLHGKTGDNGKGTYIAGQAMIAGDYGLAADFSTFEQTSFSKGGSAPTPDIARLSGKRFVHAAEANAGTKLNAGLIKNMTGRDPITARMLRGQPFSFLPGFKLWLQANDPPVISDEDEAMWRRVLRVPFDHKFSPRDEKVKDRLSDPKLSGPGILAWAIRGCHEWHANGLKVPDQIRESVDEYKAAMDPLAEFYEARCKFGPDEREMSVNMYQAYLQWCERTPRVPDKDRLGRRAFVFRLTKFKGCTSYEDKKRGGRVLDGIGLREETTPY